MLWEWLCWSAHHPGRFPDYIKGQISGLILHILYHADLTISVITQPSLADLSYMYSKGKRAQLYN